MITYKEVEQYHRDGYLLVENLFTQAEVERMLAAVEGGERVAATTRGRKDNEGNVAKLAIWHSLGNDIWAAASTAPRLINSIRILLGEDAAFFHGKVMLKEARSGGAWEWHQDYGYWYKQGFIYPHMISAFTALDPATRENGCLRVLKGSHKLNRLDHLKVGEQTGADPGRISQIENMFELVECEMSPGSVLFFHCNLLHSSSENRSDYHRRAFITCYNAVSNPEWRDGKARYQEACPVGTDDAILAFPSGVDR